MRWPRPGEGRDLDPQVPHGSGSRPSPGRLGGLRRSGPAPTLAVVGMGGESRGEPRPTGCYSA